MPGSAAYVVLVLVIIGLAGERSAVRAEPERNLGLVAALESASFRASGVDSIPDWLIATVDSLLTLCSTRDCEVHVSVDEVEYDWSDDRRGSASAISVETDDDCDCIQEWLGQTTWVDEGWADGPCGSLSWRSRGDLGCQVLSQLVPCLSDLTPAERDSAMADTEETWSFGYSFFAVSQEPASAARRSPNLVADSVRDFSGSQGEHGWSYGYWDETSDADRVYEQTEDFQPLPHFGDDRENGLSRHSDFTTGKLWYLEDGRYYTSLWATGGHAHGTMDLGDYARADHWAVRRWTSTVNSRVEIRGHAGKTMPWGENWSGDVEFRVIVGGVTVYEASLDDGGREYAVNAQVEVGTPVDFLIGPGTAIGVVDFTGSIRAVDEGAK
ncbi:MAG: hypothetical protein R3E97_20000 [Candidatus Eisenbacteria bacterium]